MDNLMLRMHGDDPLFLVILLAGSFLFLVELSGYRNCREKLRNAKKRSRRKLETDARRHRSFLIGIPALMLVMAAVYVFSLVPYLQDHRENAPLTAVGTVTYTGWQSRGRNLPKRFMLLMQTEDGGELKLYIHKSLVEAYALEDGAVYEVSYFPRTGTLCEAVRR